MNVKQKNKSIAPSVTNRNPIIKNNYNLLTVLLRLKISFSYAFEPHDPNTFHKVFDAERSSFRLVGCDRQGPEFCIDRRLNPHRQGQIIPIPMPKLQPRHNGDI